MAFNERVYGVRMHQTSQESGDRVYLQPHTAPHYQVVLTTADGGVMEEQVREVIARRRGALKSVCRMVPAHARRLSVHLGRRRIDDVLAALEGVGFDIEVLIVAGERPQSYSSPDDELPAASARASNL